MPTSIQRHVQAGPTVATVSLVVVLGVVAATAGAILTLSPRFGTNDDPAMWGIVSGAAYGTPGDYTVFMNPLVGLCLRVLYTISSTVPWYGIVFHGLQTVATALMALAVVVVAPRRVRSILAVVVVLVGPFPNLVVHLQFTSVAILVAGSGLVLFVAMATTEYMGDRTAPTWWCGASGFLIGLGFLIRFSSGLAVGLVGAPLAAVAVYRLRHRRQAIGAAAGVLVIVVGLGIAANTLRHLDDPELETFEEFQFFRSQLHGTPKLTLDPQMKGVLDDIGWTTTDLAMFDSWFFTNSEVFDTADLAAIYAERRGIRNSAGLSAVAGDLRLEYGRSITLFLAGLVLVSMGSTWQTKVGLASTAATFGAVALALGVYLRFPTRVALPLFMVLLLAGSASTVPSRPRPVPAVRARGSLLVLSVVAIGAMARVAASDLSTLASDRHIRSRVQADFLADFDVVAQWTGAEGVVVNWAGYLQDEYTSPLAIESHPEKEMEVVGLDWRSRSPAAERQLERLGMENVELAIADRPDVSLATTPTRAALYSGFMEQHYGRQIVLWPVAKLWGGGRLYNRAVSVREADSRIVIVDASLTSIATFTSLGEDAIGGLDVLHACPGPVGGIEGWAMHPVTGAASDMLLVFIDDALAGLANTVVARPDVLERTGIESSVASGFYAEVPSRRLTRGTAVRIVAVFGETWAEVPGSGLIESLMDPVRGAGDDVTDCDEP